MTDDSEKSHGGFGPTKTEWDAIYASAEREAEDFATGLLKDIDRGMSARKDAETTYAFKGKHYHFMRSAVLLLLQLNHRDGATAAKAAGFRNERMQALERKVDALSGVAVSKALDAEAYDAMGELAERLDRMEKQMTDLAEHRFTYRGYWSKGMSVERGDAYSHNGSLWYAQRQTVAEPSRECPDWIVAARKGSDATGGKRNA